MIGLESHFFPGDMCGRITLRNSSNVYFVQFESIVVYSYSYLPFVRLIKFYKGRVYQLMDSIVEAFKAAVPVLRYSLHKGECGRIGVIGGSKE